MRERGMGTLSIQHSWVLAFGVLGNIGSFLVYLAPVPTFYRIVKKKSTEGFQPFPYLLALFGSMLWIYYGTLKPNSFLLISINAVGCVRESLYLALYIVYAPKKSRVMTVKLLLTLNSFRFFSIFILTHFLSRGSGRVRLMGWICVAFAVTVFAAPLGIMREVMRTKSVEFMPFYLSFFLTMNAIMWFFNGLLQTDFYITTPNVLGCIFGVLQMGLYVIYGKHKQIPEEPKLPTFLKESVDRTSGVHPLRSISNISEENKDHNLNDCDDKVNLTKQKESIEASDQVASL